MRPSAIVFDFDGVILESAGIKTWAFRRLFEGKYPDHVDEIVEYHLRQEGISRYEKFAHIYEAILDEPLDPTESIALGNRFSSLVLKGILSAPCVPGAREFLEVHRERMPLFVASGTPQEELEYIVRKRGLNNHFTEVHGTPRTKEQIIVDLLRRHTLAPQDVVLVGDAESDCVAAAATGLVFIARCSDEQSQLAEWPSRISDLTLLDECIEAL